MYTCIYIQIHTYISVYIHINIRYVCICKCTRTYIHMHMHIHARTHTHTHTQNRNGQWSWGSSSWVRKRALHTLYSMLVACPRIPKLKMSALYVMRHDSVIRDMSRLCVTWLIRIHETPRYCMLVACPRIPKPKMSALYRVAKTHRIPYLYRSFSAKEPYI